MAVTLGFVVAMLLVAKELVGELLIRKCGNGNPNDHQTAANPLGSKGVSDRPGTGTATQRSVGLVRRLGRGDHTGRPGRPTCGLPVACADNPHGDHQQF